MSESITQQSYKDAPELIAMLMCVLMFKLGGQVTLTLAEIEHIHKEYPQVRFTLVKDPVDRDNPAKEQLTITLLSYDHVDNDKPKTTS